LEDTDGLLACGRSSRRREEDMKMDIFSFEEEDRETDVVYLHFLKFRGPQFSTIFLFILCNKRIKQTNP